MDSAHLEDHLEVFHSHPGCRPADGGNHGAAIRLEVGHGGERRAIRTRACGSLGEAILAATGPQHFAPAAYAAFQRVAGQARMVRWGTDCYAYAMVAAGQVDVVVECGLKPVDIAPFVPLVEAAGGAITDWSGRPIGPTLPHDYNGEVVAVGDPSLLGPVLDALAA